MAKLIYGERISKLGTVSVGCSAVAFDKARKNVLLTRRTDNGRWCLPGGALDPGESVKEAVVRELKEETGLDVEVTRLVGIYSDPNRLLEYPDGNRFHLISLHFEVGVIGGQLVPSEETSEFLWAPTDSLAGIDVMEHHVERISDALKSEGVVVK